MAGPYHSYKVKDRLAVSDPKEIVPISVGSLTADQNPSEFTEASISLILETFFYK